MSLASEEKLNAAPRTAMSIYRKLFGAVFVQATGAILLLILHVQMTRILGAEAYGIFIYVAAWINIAAIFGKFGTDRGVVRLVSRAVAHGDFHQMQSHIRWATRLVAGFTLTAAAVSTVLFILIEGVGRELVHVTAAVGLIVLFPVSFSFLQKGALLGLGAAAVSKLPTEILRPLFMISGIIILAAVVPAPSATELMWLNLASYVAAIAIGHFLWRHLRKRTQSDTLNVGTSDGPTPTLRDFSPFLVVSASYAAMRYTDVLLIGVFAGPEEVAYYSVAARIVSLVAFVQRAASPVVQPIISQAYSRGEMHVVQDTVAKTTSTTALATFFIGAGLLAYGKSALTIFGQEYEQAQLILYVLLAGQVVNIVAGPNAALLSMTDNQRIAARALWLAAAINIAGNLALVWRFGALGASVTTTISILLWNSLLVWACRNKIEIDPTVFSAVRHLWRVR